MVTPLNQNVDKFVVENHDILNFVVDFKSKYGKLPTKEVVKQNFSHFDLLKIESPIEYYIDEVKSQNISNHVRTIIKKAAESLKDGTDPQKVISKLSSESISVLRDTGRLTDSNIIDYDDRLDLLKDRIANPDKSALGIPSGIRVIDTIFGGWQPGDFIVVMGYTGMGKSFLTRLFACNAWEQGYVPLVISLEMDKHQELYRIDTILNKGEVFKNSQLTSGKGINPDQYEYFLRKKMKDRQPFHLVTSDGIDSADQNFVQAKIDQYSPDMVILDYHTLFDDARNGGTETEKAKNLSQDFKRIAMRNRIPVIDVAGVTMADGHGKRPPELSEIAWSKQLSYDADLALATFRDDNDFEIVARKVRRCPYFAFHLDWDLDSGKWKEKFTPEEKKDWE